MNFAPPLGPQLGLVVLLAGLIGFLGLHSLRLLADDWRQARIAALGAPRWRALYSLASIAFFLLLLWGFAEARQGAAPLFLLPDGLARGLRHGVALLLLPAFWLMTAAYVPGNHLKASLGHPMTLAVKLWALAHLLVNHSLPDLLLFGAFLLWAVLLFRSARRRVAPTAPAAPAGRASATALTLLVGTAAFALFAFWLHGAWLGLRPLG